MMQRTGDTDPDRELPDGLISVRITRMRARKAGQAGPIQAAEWRTVVRTDPTLELTDSIVGIDPQSRETINIPTPDAARWSGHPAAIPYVFQFRSGEVVVHSGDRHVLEKARELAALLSAEAMVTVD